MLNHLEYQQLTARLLSRDITFLLASDKPETGRYLEAILPAAVLGMNLLHQEPAFDNPELAAHWKVREVENLSVHEDWQGDPKDTIIFASDVVARTEDGQILHQDARKNILSAQQIESKKEVFASKLKNPDATSDWGDELNTLMAALTARTDFELETGVTPEDSIVERFRTQEIFFWDCAFVVKNETGKRVSVALTVGVDLAGCANFDSDELRQAYNPKINMGLDLVKMAGEKGGAFFIQLEDGQRLAITVDQAYQLIVAKVPLSEILLAMIQSDTEKILLTPALFADTSISQVA